MIIIQKSHNAEVPTENLSTLLSETQMTHITYTDECEYMPSSARRLLLTENYKICEVCTQKTHAKDR